MDSKKQENNEINRSIKPVFLATDPAIQEQLYFLEYLLIGLADESIPVGLICSQDVDIDSVRTPALEIIPYPELQIPFMGRQNLRKLLERLDRFKPTVLHCLSELQSGFVRRLSKKLNIPYVLSVNRLISKNMRLSLSSDRCAKIVVPAQTITDSFMKNYPRFAKRVCHINVGTFIGQTSWCFSDTNKLASIITAGSTDEKDEFEILLAAVRNLAIEGYEFMLVMIISGERESKLRQKLDEMGLSHAVTIMPQGPSCKHILDAGDIFIQPRPSDKFNSLALEAMSVGTVVAACKGGIDDIFMDGRTAVIFDPDDELSVRGILKKLLDQNDFARQLAQKAQQYVRKNHSVSTMVMEILKVYESASADIFELT